MALKYHQVRWLQAFNEGTAAIPAKSVVEITGASYDTTSMLTGASLILTVDIPSADSVQPIGLTSWMPIAPDTIGLVTLDGPALVDHQLGLLSPGTILGAEQDSYLPHENQTGLIVLGNPTISTALVEFTLLGLKKPKCRFTLDSALTTTDEYQDATIVYQYGQGADHTSTSIVVWNLPKQSGNYEFYGDSGDYGTASFSGDDGKWIIDIVECP